MSPSDTIWGVFLISQFSIGVMGNSLVFVPYGYTFSVQPHLKKPIDPVFMHLMMVNILNIIFTLLPDIASCFGVREFLDNIGCKTVLYIFRVTRSLSICTTSFLSAFQATIISPSNSKWAWLKSKLSMWIFPSFLFFWISSMLVNFYNLERVVAKKNVTLTGYGYSHAYCQNKYFGYHSAGSLLIGLFLLDLLIMVLMLWTSLYMVVLLYRHHKRAQYVHSTRLSSLPSPENKATHHILYLVSCFVLFYWSNNFVTVYGFYTPKKIPKLQGISGVLASCYPTICPFLLMKNNKIISKFTSSL